MCVYLGELMKVKVKKKNKLTINKVFDEISFYANTIHGLFLKKISDNEVEVYFPCNYNNTILDNYICSFDLKQMYKECKQEKSVEPCYILIDEITHEFMNMLCSYIIDKEHISLEKRYFS